MPQVNPQSSRKTTNVQENKLFRERLMDRFTATQFVRVINIDDEPFEWEVFPPEGEDVAFDTDGLMRQVNGRKTFVNQYKEVAPGNEQLWVINPGESEVIPGWNAYIMIEGLYKRLVAKNYVVKKGDVTEGKAGRSFNWNDGKTQEELIDKIFLGVENPRFNEQPRTTKAPSKA